MSQEILGKIASSRGPVAMAMVVGVRGSSPRELGAMMLLGADGVVAGSVGGGRVELEALRAAADCLASGSSTCLAVEMLGREATGAEPICGGAVDVIVEYVPDASLYEAAATELGRGRGVVMAYDALAPGESRPGSLARAVIGKDGAVLAGDASGAVLATAAEAGRQGFAASPGGAFCLRVSSADSLLVLGGGHVGLAVARLGSELGFRVVVGDDRPEFAAPGRFPSGVTAVCGPYLSIVDGFGFGDSAYVVVATPSHESDLGCVRAVMGRAYRYLGFVGSKRKTRMILDRLVEEGFDKAEVEAVRAPIGMDIGAETPAEIAVSIFAEIVAARRGSPALAAMDEDRARRRA